MVKIELEIGQTQYDILNAVAILHNASIPGLLTQFIEKETSRVNSEYKCITSF